MEYRVGYLKTWKKDMDKGGGTSKTETSGYVPVDRRIENLMLAGHRLVESRKAEDYYNFHPNDEIDLSYDDPTRQKGYDPADATQDTYIAKARIEAQKRLNAAKVVEPKSNENTTQDM